MPRKIFDAWSLQPLRLERTDPGANQHGTRPVLRTVCRQPNQVLIRVMFQLTDFFTETGDGAGREPLLGRLTDVVLRQNLGKSGDVVDVFLRIDGDELPTELLKAVDDLGAQPAHTRVEGGEEPDGTRRR